MNNKEFIAQLSTRLNQKQDETQKVVNTMIQAMQQEFDEGESVCVMGFGTFEVKKRLERVMVNPTTGLRMLVPPKLVLGFKPGSLVKKKIKKGGEA